MKDPNANLLVSYAIALSVGTRTKGAVLTIPHGTGETVVVVTRPAKGKRGRPKADDPKGFGSRTKLTVKNHRTGTVKETTIQNLINLGARCVGFKEQVFAGR